LKRSAILWIKIVERAISSSHKRDRPAGRGSAWHGHQSEKLGVEIVIPEIADYEVRRELVRAGKDRGIGRLDALKGMIAYAAITTPVMLKAAEFWASARKMGRQAADDASLDADMILAAQAAAIAHEGGRTVIATTNVRHLALKGYPLDSGSPNWLWSRLRQLGRLHYRRIGGRPSRSRLLHEPIKQLATTLGGSAIEAKREFIQVVGQMLRLHRTLVGAE
jgi:hypothetical protein